MSRGLGTQLFQALFDVLRQTDVCLAIGGIEFPNSASVVLHQKWV